MNVTIKRQDDGTYNVYTDGELTHEGTTHAGALAIRRASLDAEMELLPLEDEYE